MILLDNYMLLTRDEEQGRLVVVSRVRAKSVSGLKVSQSISTF